MIVGEQLCYWILDFSVLFLEGDFYNLIYWLPAEGRHLLPDSTGLGCGTCWGEGTRRPRTSWIWAEALKGPDESLLSFLFATESQVPSRGCFYSVDSGIILQSPSGPVAAAPDRQCAQNRLLWLKTTVVIPPTFYLEKFENKVERVGPSAPHLASPIGNILPHLLPFSCSLSLFTGLFESCLQVWRYRIPKYFNIIS